MVNVVSELSDALFDVYELEATDPAAAHERLCAVYHTLRLYYDTPEDELRQNLRDLDHEYQRARRELEAF